MENNDTKMTWWQKLLLWIFGAGVAVTAGMPFIPESELLLSPDLSQQGAAIQWDFGTPEGTTYEVAIKDESFTYRDSWGHFTFTPLAMRFDGETVRDAKPRVKREMTSDGYASYADVLGDGVTLLYTAKGRRAEKNVRIDSLESLGEIPADAQYLEIAFLVDTNYIINPGKVREVTNLGPHSRLDVPEVWDSSKTPVLNEGDTVEEKYRWTKTQTENKRQDIEGEFYKEDGRLIFIKRIPISFLKVATYPVFTDVDITYGSSVAFDSNSAPVNSVHMAKLDDNKFVVCWGDDADTVTEGRCRVGTVSGTTVSFAGAQSDWSTDCFGSGICYQAVAQLGTDKWMIFYSDDIDDDGYMRVGTSTGSSIAWGNAVKFQAADAEEMSATAIGSGKVALIFNDEGNSDTATALACNESSSVPACGAENDYAVTDYYSVAQDIAPTDTADAFVSCFASSDLGGTLCFASTVSTLTITHGTVATPLATGNFFGKSCLATIGAGQFSLLYQNGGAAEADYDQLGVVGTISGTTITLGSAAEYADATNDYMECFGNVLDTTTTGAAFYADDSASLGNGDAFSDRYSVVFGTTRSFTQAASEDAVASSGIIQQEQDSGYAIMVDSDTVVACFDDTDNTSEGQCIAGDFGGGGGGATGTAGIPSAFLKGLWYQLGDAFKK